MTTLHQVRLADCPSVPWRNGGGLTRELLLWPAPGSWQLRVSVARIERDGLFSAFAGVQRWIAVVFGNGMTLDLPRGRVTLTSHDEPLGFDGEDAPDCALIEGPTEDLNLMTLREAGRASMRRATPGVAVDGVSRWRGLFALGATRLDIDDVTEGVGAATLVWSDAPDPSRWRVRDGGPAWLLVLGD